MFSLTYEDSFQNSSRQEIARTPFPPCLNLVALFTVLLRDYAAGFGKNFGGWWRLTC
jgi:hypothetical protein